MAQGIEPVTRTDVTPGTTGSYQDVDVSSLVPAGAEGIVLEVINTSVGTNYAWEVRKNGSSDTLYGQNLSKDSHTFCGVGVDGNRVFEAKIASAAIEIYLVGYIPDGAGEFLDNVVDKGPGTAGSYQDIDISGDVSGGTAKVAFFFVRHTNSASYKRSLRENGSSDDFYDGLYANLRGAMMACDGSEIVEAKVENTNVDFLYIGCIYTGYADSWADAKDYSTGTTGAYVETTLTDIGSGSKGAFFTFHVTDNTKYSYGVRKNGETGIDNYYDSARPAWGWVEVDGDKKIEQKIENANLDLKVWAYVKSAALVISPSSIASAEAFGTARVNQKLVIPSIASAEAFGTATVTAGLFIYPGGITSSEAFGSAVIAGPIIATGIPSAEAFGTPTISLEGDYATWTDWGVTAYAVALCSHGSKVFAFRIGTNGNLYRCESSDNGANWGSWINMGNIGASPADYRLAACFKDADEAIVLYSNGTTLYRRRWNGETWEAAAAWSNTLQTITGLAVTHMGDWNVVVTGIDASDKPGVWTCILGDGYSGAVDTWSSLYQLTIASAGSNLEFHAPSLSFPDVFRTFFIEKYTGSAAYSRPYWSHSLATADFISNLWREAVPFDLSANYGVAITYSGSYVWLATPSGVWRASLVPASVNVTEDVLAVTSSTEPHSGRVVVTLRNDDGRYGDVGTGDYAAIREGSKLLLSLGYRTTSGAEASLGPAYWIEAWEYISEAGRCYFLLHGRDGWWLLDRWRARRQFSWAQGGKNIFQLLAFLFARAGLEFSAFSTSSAVVNQYPAFTIHPRESGAAAVRRLLEMVPDVLFFVRDCGYIKNPVANEASAYSYGGDHAILEGRYTASAQGINRVQVYGDGLISERFDWEEIAKVYDRLAQIHDLNLDTLAKAEERGDAQLRKEHMAARGGEIVVPVNCGQDLYDVIEITDERVGLTSVKRRVIGITLRYSTMNEARYEQRLGLGGV